MKRFCLSLFAISLCLSAQVSGVPNTDFPTFRATLNASLLDAASISGGYTNPSWILSMAFAKISGVPAFARTDQGNTWTTGVQDFSAATHLRVPNAAGYTPTTNGHFGYDTAANAFKGYAGAAVKTFAYLDSTITGNAANVTGIVAPANGGSGVANTATQTLGSSNVNWATLASGIVFHTTATGAKRPAVYGDIVSLWGSGSCVGYLKHDGTCSTVAGGSGDVVGPSSATDTAIPRFSTTTGKLIQNSGVTIDGSNNLATPGTLSIGVGSGLAGKMALGAGTATAAPTGFVGFQAPATVTTSYYANLPGAPSTGFLRNTGTTDPTTITYVELSAVNPQTATYQVLAADFSAYKTITVASGTFTITLVPSGSQPPDGQYITVVNYGSGTITIARSGQNINGGTSSVTLAPASATSPTSGTFTSNGTNYFARLSSAGALLSSDRVRTCVMAIGDPGSASAVLADDNDGPGECGNSWGVDWTITSVACRADAGSPTITPILSGGTSTSVLTGALTCGTGAWAAGTLNGSPVVHSFAANGATCSSTPCTIDNNITTAGGVAKHVVVRITGSL